MKRRGVRITGGRLRGRLLEVGGAARPTEARVRQALFHIWGERIEGSRFLDLFSGSGAVAFEAISRGAAHAVLVEASQRVLEALGRNRRALGVEAETRLQRLRLPRGIGRLEPLAPFDLIYADPPYAYQAHDDLLRAALPLLAEGGELALEHRSGTRLETPAGLIPEQRRYGDTAITFFRRGAVGGD